MYKILPSIGLELNDKNMGDIKDLIDRCIDDPSFAEGRTKARSETWVHIGEGAERSVDFIMKKYKEVVTSYSQTESEEKGSSKHKAKKLSLKGF